MIESAQKILLTDVGSTLGEALAKNLLNLGMEVYGSGKTHPGDEVLTHNKFTLIDLDLSQPLPQHLPKFDTCIHLSSEKLESTHSLSSVSKNIINIAKTDETSVYFCAPITSSTESLELMIHEENKKKKLKLFLIGDVYSATTKKGSNGYYSDNNLTSIINQAQTSDRIILDNEGLNTIYPTYIKDAVRAISKYIFQNDNKNLRFIVSQSPITALSAAYELQNVVRSINHKDLGIYFRGNSQDTDIQPEPIVRIPDLGFSPKYSLTEGLKEVFITRPNHLEPTKTLKVDNQSNNSKIQEVTDKKVMQKKLKVPSFRPKINIQIHSKLRLFLVILLILAIGLVAKTSVEIILGIQKLKNAREQVLAGDFTNSAKNANNAASHFDAASFQANILSKPLTPIFTKEVSDLNDLLKSASLTARAAANLATGAEGLLVNLKSITVENEKEAITNQDLIVLFNRAHLESSYALSLLDKIKSPRLISARVETFNREVSQLKDLSKISSDISLILPSLTGSNTKKSYLVLLLNNTELRPGGGFIGNYAQIDFENAKLKKIEVDDIYNIDGQLKEIIEPPIELTQKLGQKQLFLRDSNWSTDFSINAKTAKDFYRKETGKTVDGVVAIDLTYVQNLLSKIGPIKLEDYNEEITDKNLFEKGEYYSEVGFFPGSTQKKDFFATLTNALISKMIDNLGSNNISSAHWTAFIDVTKQALERKHMQISIEDRSIAPFIRTSGWDNPLPPHGYDVQNDNLGTKDLVAISEANLGANKSNRYIKRDVSYEMTIGKEADLVGELKITYHNESPSESWPAGTYVNYLRVYVPKGSAVSEFSNGDNEFLDLVKVEEAGSLSVFSSFIEVPVQEKKTVRFKYRIPKNVNLEKAPSYTLSFLKQPGTENDRFIFKFNLPAYLKTTQLNNNLLETQNYEINTDLTIDRKFEIKIARK